LGVTWNKPIRASSNIPFKSRCACCIVDCYYFRNRPAFVCILFW